MVWQKDSPLWGEIESLKRPLPTYEEVKLPEEEGGVAQAIMSPSGRNMHSAVRRLLGQDKVQIRSKPLYNCNHFLVHCCHQHN
jgi:hypothetical protein